MSTASYNCPCCCGGPLKFSGESGKLECTACGNNYEPEALEMMTPEESIDEITFANDAGRAGNRRRRYSGGSEHENQSTRRVCRRRCDRPAAADRQGGGGRQCGCHRRSRIYCQTWMKSRRLFVL